MRRSMTYFSVLLSSGLLIPAFNQMVDASLNPSSFKLSPNAIPANSALTTQRVDRTAAKVDSEGIFGGDDKHGNAYQHLHFSGSLFEQITLPRYGGARGQLWLMTSVFPNASAAQQAYSADSNYLGDQCQSSPALSIQATAQTCGYIAKQVPESGFYVIATSGPVEFIVLAFRHAASTGARDNAMRNAFSVATQEVHIIRSVLGSSGIKVKRQHSSPTATAGTKPPTSTPQATAQATMTPIPASTSTSIPTPTPQPTATPAPPGVNSTITTILSGDSWQLTLTSVQTANIISDQSNSFKANGKFVAVFVTATNNGRASAALWKDQNFALTDSQGRTFDLITGDAASAAEYQFNTDDSAAFVQPGLTAHTVFIFDVAPDAQGLTLTNVVDNGAQSLFSLGI